jgi:hypothetical protein
VCLDEKYADQERIETLKEKEEDALSLLKLLNGYISYLQRQKVCEA